jgi:hypothetical protein
MIALCQSKTHQRSTTHDTATPSAQDAGTDLGAPVQHVYASLLETQLPVFTGFVCVAHGVGLLLGVVAASGADFDLLVLLFTCLLGKLFDSLLFGSFLHTCCQL